MSIKTLFLILFSMLLVSCARTPNVKQYFFNGIPEHKAYLKPKTSQILLVSQTVAGPAYQTKDMLYVQTPYQLSQFARHAWVAPPAEMMGPLLVQSIQSTGHFNAVVAPPYVGLADFRLDTKLVSLYQLFEGKSSCILLIMQAELVDVAHSRLLKSQYFSVRIQTPENTPYGGVIAANQAVREVLDRIAQFAFSIPNYSEVSVYHLPKPNLRS